MTGGSRGIGAAISTRPAAAEQAREVAGNIEAEDGKVVVVQADLDAAAEAVLLYDADSTA
ncbi:hypothetical protein SMC26_11935 [Actinomadura fulvescens]|uniref:Oxidoreductase n=1 Tax=Actinomadura fulvescens TaxID=46160 RepID=A0ABP6BQE2_9ACTN